MSTHIRFSRKFVKKYDRLPQKVQQAVDSRINLFEQSPSHPLLRNHALVGRLNDYRSINITGDYRAVFKTITRSKTETTFLFILIGTHSELYG